MNNAAFKAAAVDMSNANRKLIWAQMGLAFLVIFLASLCISFAGGVIAFAAALTSDIPIVGPLARFFGVAITQTLQYGLVMGCGAALATAFYLHKLKQWATVKQNLSDTKEWFTSLWRLPTGKHLSAGWLKQNAALIIIAAVCASLPLLRPVVPFVARPFLSWGETVANVLTLFITINGTFFGVALHYGLQPGRDINAVLGHAEHLTRKHTKDYIKLGLSMLLWGLACIVFIPIWWMVPRMWAASMLFHSHLLGSPYYLPQGFVVQTIHAVPPAYNPQQGHAQPPQQYYTHQPQQEYTQAPHYQAPVMPAQQYPPMQQPPTQYQAPPVQQPAPQYQAPPAQQPAPQYQPHPGVQQPAPQYQVPVPEPQYTPQAYVPPMAQAHPQAQPGIGPPTDIPSRSADVLD